MKGPSERLKYDLRRTWECPLCRRKERTSGDVTSLHCNCPETNGQPATPMKLVDEGHRYTRPL